MDIYKISKHDLDDRNFAFKDMDDFNRKGFQEKPFVFDGFVIGVCESGKAKIRINYKDYPIAGNYLFVVLPKCVFSLPEHSSDFKMWFLLISPDFIYHLLTTPDFAILRSTGDCPCITLGNEQMNDIRTIASLIGHYDDENRQQREIRETLAHSITLIVASAFGSLTHNVNIRKDVFSRKKDITRNFIDLLSNYGSTEKKVAFYADKLCITPKYLTTVVKATTGRSAQNWIKDVTLVEARHYLKTTEITIQEVSEKLHFQTTSSFIRFFKTHTGFTPLEYREMREGK